MKNRKSRPIGKLSWKLIKAYLSCWGRVITAILKGKKRSKAIDGETIWLDKKIERLENE